MHMNKLGRRVARPTTVERPARALSALAFAMLVVSTGCAEELEIDSPVEVDVNASPLQSKYLNNMFSGVFMVTGSIVDTNQARATAVVKTRMPKPHIPFGSCGATFVSPHYAVTAAHCVENMALNAVSPSDLFLEEVVLGNLDASEFSAYQTITGNWGQGVGWGHGTLNQGYQTTRFNQCRVVRRCSHNTTDPNGGACPLGATVDIALIHCPDRASTRFAFSPDIVELILPHLPASSWDQMNQALNIWWFHELYDLPIEPGPPSPPDRWEHYGQRAPENQNFHYTKWHQVIPLVSIAHPEVVNQQAQHLRVVGANGQFPNEMVSNAPACHGTSGSGVFAHDTNVFLGPLVHADPQGNSQLSDRLCDRFNSGQSASLGRSSYINARTTAAFVRGAPEVYGDLGL
jgi:hypothetical protein